MAASPSSPCPPVGGKPSDTLQAGKLKERRNVFADADEMTMERTFWTLIGSSSASAIMHRRSLGTPYELLRI
jgi:hypothetical protein